MKLTAKNVGMVTRACLSDDTSISLGERVEARGVLHSFMFDKAAIERCREDIDSMLDQLPATFHQGRGDGWWFLNACETKDGERWGEHIHVEQLFCLGIATGRVVFTLPRDMWPVHPGGMPYVSIARRPDCPNSAGCQHVVTISGQPAMRRWRCLVCEREWEVSAKQFEQVVPPSAREVNEPRGED